MLGGIEAGGTKMVVAIGDDDCNIIKKKEIPTKAPEETIPAILEFFDENDVTAIGIGAFGPVCVDRNSKDYGKIGRTPKLSWVNFSWSEAFKSSGIPVAVDTDVNAAVLGEVIFGNGKDLSDVIYITIGTGIGAGVYCSGQLLHGMLHPEAGHILLSLDPKDRFEGNCPYHKTGFEGLAAGPAIEKRYGKKAAELKDLPQVWELEAGYIAKALVNYIMILSPKKIVLGGGVMHQEQLFPLIREKTVSLLNGYINTKEIKNIEDYIVPASLNDDQGILGCAKLAELAM